MSIKSNLKNISQVLIALLLINCQPKENNSSSLQVVSSNKPNILIVFPDQLRRYSAGFWSQDKYKEHLIGKPDPVITPNIDKLANNGVVFTNAISNFPLCSPYRGMLLSGMYPEQNGIWNNCRKDRSESLKDDIPTITDLFYKAGYNTSYFGKCHWLKTEPLFDYKGNYRGTTEPPGGHFVNTYDTYIPPGKSRHSIEYFYQSLKDIHFNPHIYSNIPNTIEGKKDGELHLPKIFSPKNEAEKIIQYLQNKNGQRESNKPFCMIWSMNPPHNPWDDANTDMDALKAHYDVDKFPEVDEQLVVRKNAEKKIAKYARHYFANVTSSDAYLGLVLDELEKMGALDNTIVIFSSDHGEMLGSHGITGKNVVELEALAIPFIVHWPNGLNSDITDILFSVPDVLPTAMGLAGISNQIPKEVQGTDFSSLLVNPKSTKIKKPEAALIMLNKARGVLTERYTLCLQEKKGKLIPSDRLKLRETFIYDNKFDPYQLHKISLGEKPKLAKELLTMLGEKLKMSNDPWYQKNKYEYLIPYPTN